MKRGVKLLAGILVVLTTTVGASAAESATTRVDTGRHGPPDAILGLDVQKEDVAKVLGTDKRALYVDRVGLYSFREKNKLLQGTLEIARFRPGTPQNSGDFQLSIVGHLGSTLPIVVRIESQRVYITTSKGLTLAVWFKEGHMMALSIRRTYAQPKELLRQALQIRP